MKFKKRNLIFGTILSLTVLSSVKLPSVHAQIPIPFDFNINSSTTKNSNSVQGISSTCIYLDGKCIFRIASLDSDLEPRRREIERRLRDISSTYFGSDNLDIEFRKEQLGNLKDLYVTVGYKEIRLLTVTNLDAEIASMTIEERANNIIQDLENALNKAREERKESFLIRRGGYALLIIFGMGLSHIIIAKYLHKLKESKPEIVPLIASDQPISSQLEQRQKYHVQSVQSLLLKTLRIGIWFGGSLLILGLFPYTRPLQLLSIRSLKIPVKIGAVILGTYVVIRLSYALIAKVSNIINEHSLILGQEANDRLQLRINTITGISKSVVAVTAMSIGTLVALSVAGINVAPLLAGAGIIGVALSFGSQSLVKDTINGFFIIFEDQYGVGDVINVGEWGGLVENMNLRITQIRDPEGRLVTIPNSEIRAVANLSSQWARADLNIPVAYQTDVNQALELISNVADKMNKDSQWSINILDTPQILGVDNFGDRGVIIKVWIKTRPLKQWEIAREFRRRLKVAFDEAGIPIPPPQQEVWFNGSLPVSYQGNQGNKMN